MKNILFIILAVFLFSSCNAMEGLVLTKDEQVKLTSYDKQKEELLKTKSLLHKSKSDLKEVNQNWAIAKKKIEVNKAEISQFKSENLILEGRLKKLEVNESKIQSLLEYELERHKKIKSWLINFDRFSFYMHNNIYNDPVNRDELGSLYGIKNKSDELKENLFTLYPNLERFNNSPPQKNLSTKSRVLNKEL